MGLLQLSPAFLPMKIISFFSLTAIILMPVNAGLSMERPDACRPVCVGDECVTVNHDRVDFNTAEEMCRSRNGELMDFQIESTLEILLDDGNLWIGLRLPDGICSNLSAPLRGYEWTSGSAHRNAIPPFSAWRDNIKRCSPHCVSLSRDQKWTERPCLDIIDGFLCQTKHKDACQTQELSDPGVFLSSQGCSDAPCEHTCTEVKGGYKCTCFDRYTPSSEDPHRCEMHCPNATCPVMCDRNKQINCFCPQGFIRSDDLCVDIDECEGHDHGCDQVCENNYGGFVCSCHKGFTLKDKVKCARGGGDESFSPTTPVLTEVNTQGVNSTLKVSSATTVSFLWVWIFVAVALLVMIFVVRYCVVKRQERSEPISQQRSDADVEC